MAILKIISNQTQGSSFPLEDGEEHLVQGAIRGEASAFGLLYDYYQPKIYRFVLIKVGHREEAEDLTHQVFMSAWQNVKNYRSRGFPFSSWLYRIARNQIIDFYRTKKETAPIEEVDQRLFVSPAAQQFKLDLDSDLKKVFDAVRGLDPQYQDVVIMRFVDDLSIRETAKALGKTEGAIKLAQHRAIKKLREIIAS